MSSTRQSTSDQPAGHAPVAIAARVLIDQLTVSDEYQWLTLDTRLLVDLLGTYQQGLRRGVPEPGRYVMDHLVPRRLDVDPIDLLALLAALVDGQEAAQITEFTEDQVRQLIQLVAAELDVTEQTIYPATFADVEAEDLIPSRNTDEPARQVGWERVATVRDVPHSHNRRITLAWRPTADPRSSRFLAPRTAPVDELRRPLNPPRPASHTTNTTTGGYDNESRKE